MGAVVGLGHGDDNAGATAPAGALNELYQVSDDDLSDFPDYSGKSNYPMFLKWKDLSRNESTTPTILNLIWTDFMANSVVGPRAGYLVMGLRLYLLPSYLRRPSNMLSNIIASMQSRHSAS